MADIYRNILLINALLTVILYHNLKQKPGFLTNSNSKSAADNFNKYGKNMENLYEKKRNY